MAFRALINAADLVPGGLDYGIMVDMKERSPVMEERAWREGRRPSGESVCKFNSEWSP